VKDVSALTELLEKLENKKVWLDLNTQLKYLTVIFADVTQGREHQHLMSNLQDHHKETLIRYLCKSTAFYKQSLLFEPDRYDKTWTHYKNELRALFQKKFVKNCWTIERAFMLFDSELLTYEPWSILVQMLRLGKNDSENLLLLFKDYYTVDELAYCLYHNKVLLSRGNIQSLVENLAVEDLKKFQKILVQQPVLMDDGGSMFASGGKQSHEWIFEDLYPRLEVDDIVRRIQESDHSLDLGCINYNLERHFVSDKTKVNDIGLQDIVNLFFSRTQYLQIYFRSSKAKDVFRFFEICGLGNKKL
jgi:hypothetical protein